MGDADILIPAERIGEGLGYLHTRGESNHAVDFHTEDESAVDMHHSLFDPDRSPKARRPCPSPSAGCSPSFAASNALSPPRSCCRRNA